MTGLTSTEEETDSDPDSDAVSEDDFAPSSAGDVGMDDEDDEVEEEDEEMDDSDDSDDLDGAGRGSKRRRNIKSTPKKGSAKKVKVSNGSGKKSQRVEGFEDDDEEDLEVELEEGQEIAGRIYPAPKTGLGELPLSVDGVSAEISVPPGRISQNTLNFLKNMQIPERNDRDWFRSHEPAFRQAEKVCSFSWRLSYAVL